jgi:hypothetical protein
LSQPLRAVAAQWLKSLTKDKKMTIIIQKTMSEAAHKVISLLNSANKSERDSAAMQIIEGKELLTFFHERSHKGQFSSSEQNAILRSIDIYQGVRIQEIQAKMRKYPMLDLATASGVIRPTAVHTQFQITKVLDKQKDGKVSYISDHTDDLPTQSGDGDDKYEALRVHATGKSVILGLLELRRAAEAGQDLISRELAKVFNDFKAHAEHVLVYGDKHKGMEGLINNKAFGASTTFPASDVNPPKTEWKDKTPTEIISDLNLMKNQSFINSGGSTYGQYANMLWLADESLRQIMTTLMPDSSGRTIYQVFMDNQASMASLAFNPTPVMNITGVAQFNGSGVGGTNTGLTGDFNSENLAMYYAAPETLPTMYHGVHYHIPVISAISGVTVYHPDMFKLWDGA